MFEELRADLLPPVGRPHRQHADQPHLEAQVGLGGVRPEPGVGEPDDLPVVLRDDQPQRVEVRLGEDAQLEQPGGAQRKGPAVGETLGPHRGQGRRIGIAEAAERDHVGRLSSDRRRGASRGRGQVLHMTGVL